MTKIGRKDQGPNGSGRNDTGPKRVGPKRRKVPGKVKLHGVGGRGKNDLCITVKNSA